MFLGLFLKFTTNYSIEGKIRIIILLQPIRHMSKPKMSSYKSLYLILATLILL